MATEPAPAYRPRPIKRKRRTRAEMAGLRGALDQLAQREPPPTAGHVFSALANNRALIAKTEQEYKNVVCRLALEMRRNGRLPHAWIADYTRWMRKPTSYTSLPAALAATAETYRR